MNQIFLAVLIGFCVIGLIWFIKYTNILLSRSHSSDVRIVWYLFSLSLVVSLGVSIWALNYGALDSAGKYQGNAGMILKKLVDLVMDIEADFIVFGGIVAIVVLPQFLAYILSGLSGSATSPRFVKGSTIFFVWSIVKSLAVAAGVVVAFDLVAIWMSWADLKFAVSCPFFATIIIAFAFLLLAIYRDTPTVVSDIRRVSPKLVKSLEVCHQWMCRASKELDTSDEMNESTP